jgi:hypothetical protein
MDYFLTLRYSSHRKAPQMFYYSLYLQSLKESSSSLASCNGPFLILNHHYEVMTVKIQSTQFLSLPGLKRPHP